ncbi:MAG: inositol monophosphatase family protein [Kofleriaceae bacterium]
MHPELLETARAAARAASAMLTDVRATDIRAKGNPRDLITEWDIRSEDVIRRTLEERAAALAILAEEGGQSGVVPGVRKMRWLVDPIDGTVNFAHGFPIWSISIALEDEQGRLIVGVVAAPALGWWFDAMLGGGAHDGTGARLAVSAVRTLEQALLTTGFPYDRATNPDNNFAQWEHFQRTAGAVRRLGSASIDLCLVARGWMDGYWERRLQPWDIAAGGLIVAEAGGTVTDATGGAFDPHRGEVAATNGAIHGELIAELLRSRS